jgi:integrase
MGYTGEEMTAHGFRGMAATILYENGFESKLVEMQLAHVEKNKVKAAYNHAEYLDQRKTMMQWFADYLDKLRDSKD